MYCVDTEGSFLPQRIATIAAAVAQAYSDRCDGITQESLLNGIHIARIYTLVDLLAFLKQLPALCTRLNARLVVVDSIAFHFRHGFDDFRLRTRVLSGLAQDLCALAADQRLAVLLVNQVTVQGDDSKVVPALGPSWAHACNHRLLISLDCGSHSRLVRVLKSSYLKEDEAAFQITADGIRDVE